MYSVYKNDVEIAFGTLDEIAAQLDIKRESVLFYGTNVYKNRTSENARRLVEVGDEE